MFLNGNSGARSDRFSITDSVFTQMPIRVPRNKLEQQKIGTFLSHVDSLIQAKTKKLESLKAVKKSLLQKCFPKAGEKVPEMRFAGFSGNWGEKKLGDVITVNSGKDYKHLDEGNIPVYGTGGYMLSVNAKLSDIDAVGIGRKGTIDNPLYLKAPFWTVDTLFFMTANNGFDLKFIYNLSQNIDWKSMDESTSIPSLSKNNIVDVEVLIPPSLEEQQKIGQFFSKYDSLISAQQREIDKLKDIKKSLLQKMFI
jgi:type I restriction enzyme S subunit